MIEREDKKAINELMRVRLTELMTKADISKGKLSQISGVGLSTINNILKGNGGEILVPKLGKLLDALYVSYADFFSDEKQWKEIMSYSFDELKTIYLYRQMTDEEREKLKQFVKDLKEADDKEQVLEQYKDELINSFKEDKKVVRTKKNETKGQSKKAEEKKDSAVKRTAVKKETAKKTTAKKETAKKPVEKKEKAVKSKAKEAKPAEKKTVAPKVTKKETVSTKKGVTTKKTVTKKETAKGVTTVIDVTMKKAAPKAKKSEDKGQSKAKSPSKKTKAEKTVDKKTTAKKPAVKKTGKK